MTPSLFCGLAFAQATNPSSVPPALRAECDGLVRSSILIGVNRGWSNGDAAISSRNGVRFDFSPGGTAAHGLALVRAAKFLNDPQYLAAADGVARSLAAVQLNSGFVPAAATFLRAGPRSEQVGTSSLPIGPTAAAVAFWLEYLDAGGASPQRWRACERAGINWLIQQQLRAGGFIAPTTRPAVGEHPLRRIDLTRSDYRNAVFVLLLAARLDDSRPAANAAEKDAERLLNLRLMNQASAPATAPSSDDDAAARQIKAALLLWTDLYEADGSPAAGRVSADIPASVLAIQTLTAEALAHPTSRFGQETRFSTNALASLGNGTVWQRHYPALPTTQPTSEPSTLSFGDPDPADQPGDFDAPETIRLSSEWDAGSAAAFVAKLEKTESLNERLAATVCQLRRSLDAPADTPLGNLWQELHP